MSARGLLLAALLSAGWAQAAPVPPGSATTGKAKRAAGSGVLNLNTATLDQIDALPGVSPRLAAAVVAERRGPPVRAAGGRDAGARDEQEALRAAPPSPLGDRTEQLRALPGASTDRRTGGPRAPACRHPSAPLSRGGPETAACRTEDGGRAGSTLELPFFSARSAAASPLGCTTSQDTPPRAMLSPVHPGRTERGPGLSPRLPLSRVLRFCREPAALRPGDRVCSHPAARGSGGNDRRPLPPDGAPAAGARRRPRVGAPRLGRGGLRSGAGRPARARLAARGALGAGGGRGCRDGSGRRAHLAALDARRGQSVPHREAGGRAHARGLAGPARRPRAAPRDGARSVVLHRARPRSPPRGGRTDRPARRPGSGGPGRRPPGGPRRARRARGPGAGLRRVAGPDPRPARRAPPRRQLRKAARPRADHRASWRCSTSTPPTPASRRAR